MVVPAFGFSAGDFIAAVGVLKKTARALRDTEGAASQQQHAVLKLRSMRFALLQLQSLEPTSEDTSIVEEIRKCGKACIIPLDKFLNTIEKLDRDLGCRERKWTKAYAQVRWAMKLEPELRRLEASLDAEVQPLQILLQLDNRENRSEADKVTLETRDLVRHTSNVFEDFVKFFHDKAASLDLSVPIAAQLDRLSTELPDFRNEFSTTMGKVQAGMENLQRTQQALQQSHSCRTTSSNSVGSSSLKFGIRGTGPSFESCLVIYGQKLGQIDAALLYLILDALSEQSIRLAIALICLMPTVQRLLLHCSRLIKAPTGHLESNIHLEDCLGRPMSLPFEHFRHWDLVYAKLKFVLRGTAGEYKIKANQFQIFVLGSPLDKDHWDSMIHPGARATMSVEFDLDTTGNVCPCCSNHNLELDKHGWKHCDQCMFKYRLLSNKESPSKPKKKRDNLRIAHLHLEIREESPELQMFRRVHFLKQSFAPVNSTAPEVSSSDPSAMLHCLRCEKWQDFYPAAQSGGRMTCTVCDKNQAFHRGVSESSECGDSKESDGGDHIHTKPRHRVRRATISPLIFDPAIISGRESK